MGVTRFLWISSGYILMLAVMTYNTGVFIVISLGIAIGFGIVPNGVVDTDDFNPKYQIEQEDFFRKA